MTSRHVDWQSGALLGLTLLFVGGALADEALRERVHREHKDRSSDPRTRVTGLVKLAGAADAAALDAALTLLTDPEPSVRDEARQLILDHPDGHAVADALGLVDEDFGE